VVLGEQSASNPVENGSKAVWHAGAVQQGEHLTVEVAGTVVKFSDFIKLFDVKLDPAISMNRHVAEWCEDATTTFVRYGTFVCC